MESRETRWTALVAYEASAAYATRGIEARVLLGASGIIVFHYVLRGEISRIRIPAVKSADRADELWRHTCFEAFVKSEGAAGYHELNFAPSRQWQAYRFDAYRAGMSAARLEPPPEIVVRRLDDRLELDASMRLQDLIALPGVRRLRVGLSAVVEDENGTLSYWALKHADGKPDFHTADTFVLELTV